MGPRSRRRDDSFLSAARRDPTILTDATTPTNGPAHRGAVPTLLWLLALFVLVALHVWFPRVDVEPLNDTFSADIGGRSAIFQFAKRRWSDVERNLEPLHRYVEWLDPETTLCLLGPARYPNPREWETLLTWVDEGGSLLLAARWDDPEIDIPGLVAKIRSKEEKKGKGSGTKDRGKEKKNVDLREMLGIEKSTGPGEPVQTTLIPEGSLLWRSRGVIEAAGSDPLVKTVSGPQVVRIHHGEGTIVLCASDQVFSNAALLDREQPNALLAVRLLETTGADQPIVFDESLNATGTPRVVGLLLDPHLRPITLQLLIILVVFGWRGGRRFGGLLPVEATPRHDLADHTDSLGNLYYKAHAGTTALKAYRDQLRMQLRLHAAAEGDPRRLAPLAARSGLAVAEIRKLLAEVDRAVERPKLTRRDAAQLIRRLARLRGPAAGERRQRTENREQTADAGGR